MPGVGCAQEVCLAVEDHAALVQEQWGPSGMLEAVSGLQVGCCGGAAGPCDAGDAAVGDVAAARHAIATISVVQYRPAPSNIIIHRDSVLTRLCHCCHSHSG